MNFNIKEFLDRHNINYREHGTGVKKGNVVIKCPYCGSDDKGEHLGISLSNGVWGCWRNDSHRGKDLARLIVKLIGITYEQARKLIGADHKVVEQDLFDELASEGYFIDKKDSKDTTVKSILLPKEFKLLKIKSPFSRYHIKYLSDRGFDNVRALASKYNLMYATKGDYKGRIVMPVYFNNRLVTWTSRAISRYDTLRYKSLSEEDSSINIKNTIFNYDNANKEGDTLFVVEGPIDTLKMDFYLHKTKSNAVGLFSMTISDDQLYLLIQLFDKYKTVVLLLDAGEIDSIEKGIAKLSSTGKYVYEGVLPRGVLDPGELKGHQVKTLYKRWSSSHG